MNKQNIISNIIGICLAFGYLFICYTVYNLQTEGSWGGFLCFLFALPFSIFSLIAINYIDGEFVFFYILNAIWWWFMGFCLGRCVSRNKQFLSIVLTVYITIMYLSMFFMWL